MLVKRLDNLDSARVLRTRWNELAGGIPFRQWEWLSTWWRHFGNEGELFLLLIETTGGELVGIAPWYLESSPLSGRTIRFLGSGLACSDYLTVLVDPAYRSEVSDALAKWLVGSLGQSADCGWDLIQLEAVDPADEAVQALITNLQRQGCGVHNQAATTCWRIPIPDSWEGYLQALPKTHRKHMRQSYKRLHDPEFRVITAQDLESWNYIWGRFVELHQRRRKSLGQPGCFVNASFESFLGETAREFFSNGQLRLVLVEKNDNPVSSLLLFEGEAASYAYQMGINPEFMSDSPGWLVIAASILAAIERGEVTIDLLRGNESYKSRMGAVPIELEDIRVIPPQFGARLRHTAWLTGAAVKKWIKRGLHAAGLGTIAS
jgi:CelD/BcsL family acetyltransferase involved in cellulose biosynthesis